MNPTFDFIKNIIFSITVTIMVCFITYHVYKYNVETNKFLFENGYQQQPYVGGTGTVWVKTSLSGKTITTEGKEVEVK